METFIQQVVTGLMTGSVYALIALAFVLIFQSSGHINFAQGEMATFTTFLAWSFMTRTPYIIGAVLAVGAAFLIGAGLHRGLIRLADGKPEISAVIIALGLFLIFNSLGASIYHFEPHHFTQPFTGSPIDIGGVKVGQHNVYVFVVAAILTGGLWWLFERTKVGLALRATAADRATADLMGVPTGLMLAFGWGLAAAVGAVAGILLAPLLVLTPSMMFFILLFALSSAVLGGFDNAPGVVVGAIIVGIVQSLVGTYLDDIVSPVGIEIEDPNAYRDIIGIVLIVLVLAVRPHGLFGKTVVQKV